MRLPRDIDLCSYSVEFLRGVKALCAKRIGELESTGQTSDLALRVPFIFLAHRLDLEIEERADKSWRT